MLIANWKNTKKTGNNITEVLFVYSLFELLQHKIFFLLLWFGDSIYSYEYRSYVYI